MSCAENLKPSNADPFTRYPCVRIHQSSIPKMKTLVLIIITIIPAFTVFSGETNAPALNGETLLSQTELNVLTRHYEKALTESYELRLQLQMLPIMEANQQLPKEEVARQAEVMRMRLKLLTEWQDDIRRRIVSLVAEQNERQRERQLREQKSASPPASKATSPSERAPSPKF